MIGLALQNTGKINCKQVIKHRPIKNATIVPTNVVQKNKFQVIDQGTVDNDIWYVVQVEPAVVPWMHKQDQTMWYSHKLNNYRVLDTFDVHEKLYTMMALKWNQ